MYELKKNGKVFTSKFVGTGTSSYEKRIYRAAVSQRLRNTALNCRASCRQVAVLSLCSTSHKQVRCFITLRHQRASKV